MPPAGGTVAGWNVSGPSALGKAVLGKDSTAAPDKASPPPERAKTVNPTKSETPAKDRVALDITPGLNPMANIRFMEVMIGTKRQFVLFNGPGNSPVVVPQDDGSAKPARGRAGRAAEESE